MRKPNIKISYKKRRAKRCRRRLLQQVVPNADTVDEEVFSPVEESSRMVQRPGFSLPVMTNNFRRFNAR